MLRLVSDPAPLGRKEGLVLLIACASAPSNESIGLVTLSINLSIAFTTRF